MGPSILVSIDMVDNVIIITCYYYLHTNLYGYQSGTICRYTNLFGWRASTAIVPRWPETTHIRPIVYVCPNKYWYLRLKDNKLIAEVSPDRSLFLLKLRHSIHNILKSRHVRIEPRTLMSLLLERIYRYVMIYMYKCHH